ncbi:helix-turn-helix domain-containing protein [Isoptericola sp. NEAU-Y5]|uniref:Helix-turn-helix domain-containing protein n=1 Tax=Isoptericola luteus TaxID=2879484 RepID=A0ABS7ZJ09_9MICO|nr:helix-turn-helix transcriptional regulator [Isoptericola sp. NEAU-Y5]MCA5894502.1 helix-turn-helix domain-containing protein [Isoptericola sp. NEAU-Y5]
MKRHRSYLPQTHAALRALGGEIAIARRELGWSAAELADRLGSSPGLVGRIERGEPGTAVGTVLEAAVLCGVPLFGVEARELGSVASRVIDKLALLPQRVRRHDIEVPDDF